MINRQNWLDTKVFLAFQEGTLQNDQSSIHRYRGALRHLLEWASEKPFGDCRTLEPTFPAYMAKPRPAAGKIFTSSGSKKELQVARQFFSFSRSEWPARYKNIAVSWIRTLQPSKRHSAQSRLKDHSHYTLESVLKITALPFDTLQDRRDIAAVAFLFLSGMRIAAFTSITIEGVDIENNDIYQLPEKGVMTKNRKAAVTHLLQIPELLEVVTAWDELVRRELSPSDLWYPVMKRDGDAFEVGRISGASQNRGYGFGARLKIICKRADVPYFSPHKIRHGHVVYALKNVKDMEGLKSVSQNVMHESIQITDSIYGGFSNSDVKRVVSAIGQIPIESGQPPADLQSLISLFSLLAKDNPEAKKLLATFGKPTPTTKTKKEK